LPHVWRYRILGIALFVLIWEVLSFVYPPAIVPGIERVVSALAEVLRQPGIWRDAGDTFLRVLLGTLLSVGIGIFFGIWSTLDARVREAVYPIFVTFEMVPPMAWIVLAILWFRLGHMPSIVVAVATAVPIVFFNLTEGAKQINWRLIEMAESFRVPLRDRIFTLYFPSLLPALLAAASGGLSMNWRVVVMAEALSAYTGLGQKLWGEYLYGSGVNVYAYILLLVLLGLTLDYGLIGLFRSWIMRRYRLYEFQERRRLRAG